MSSISDSITTPITRFDSHGGVLFVCAHCEESIGHLEGLIHNPLVHITTASEGCRPYTKATKKMGQLAKVHKPTTENPVPTYALRPETGEIYKGLPSFNDVVKELTTYKAEPVRSPSGKAQSQRGCKNCGQTIWWDGTQWKHWAIHSPNLPTQCTGSRVIEHRDSK
jgi:hypothetical protein